MAIIITTTTTTTTIIIIMEYDTNHKIKIKITTQNNDGSIKDITPIDQRWRI
jgi:hypothetical protein